ncbi:hypothetical protein J6590_025822 [Homalodisca vitripennis]|nr:hypothetical protein J6590_025822 [Homalodisca vitripennis]
MVVGSLIGTFLGAGVLFLVGALPVTCPTTSNLKEEEVLIVGYPLPLRRAVKDHPLSPLSDTGHLHNSPRGGLKNGYKSNRGSYKAGEALLSNSQIRHFTVISPSDHL